MVKVTKSDDCVISAIWESDLLRCTEIRTRNDKTIIFAKTNVVDRRGRW